MRDIRLSNDCNIMEVKIIMLLFNKILVWNHFITTNTSMSIIHPLSPSQDELTSVKFDKDQLEKENFALRQGEGRTLVEYVCEAADGVDRRAICLPHRPPLRGVRLDMAMVAAVAELAAGAMAAGGRCLRLLRM